MKNIIIIETDNNETISLIRERYNLVEDSCILNLNEIESDSCIEFLQSLEVENLFIRI
jgi:hypothetical protein